MRRIVKIESLPNGAHQNYAGTFSAIPDGWAVIPEDMETENFPFGEVEAEEADGVMTVTRWTPGELPAPATEPEHEPTAEEILNALLGVSRYE